MNKDRRNRIAKLIGEFEALQGEIEDIHAEEEDAFNNLPESLQDGERGQAMQQAVDSLDNAKNALEELLSELNTAIE